MGLPSISCGGASAGPTGVPWVDTNSWKIRLETARRPSANIWVDAPPKGARVSVGSYRTAIADAAANHDLVLTSGGVDLGQCSVSAPRSNSAEERPWSG